MKRKIIISILALSMLFAFASFVQARASETITSTTVSASPGDSRGKINVTFIVQTATSTTRLGAESIEVYESNGDYIGTIWGSTYNQLISTEGGRYYSYTYTYTGDPGTTYYFIVNCIAANANGSDTRERETNLVQAPY